MKHYISIFILLITLMSCEDQLNNPVAFSFTATALNSTKNGDTLIVDKSFPVNFAFGGNAEFITFYSG